jgi:Holliday junction resolvase RusA-like endonuclease
LESAQKPAKLTELEVVAPFAIYLPRKTTKDKRIPINLNWFRNAQHFESNSAKKQYLELVRTQLEGKQLETPVEVSYQVFKPTKRRLDKMNVASITSKFLLDAMSDLGVWEDDNDDFVKTETILPTVHDKGNERVVVRFKTIGDKV